MQSGVDQYWYSGMHDAYVKKAERGFNVDKKQKYLKFFIYASGAMYDMDVESITFYNYKIIKGNYNLTGVFWTSDTLKNNGNKYILEIEYVMFNNDKDTVIIEFEQLEVSRIK